MLTDRLNKKTQRLTYNIAYGVIASVITYILLNVVPWFFYKISKGRIAPPGWETDRVEYKRPPGGVIPLWMYVFPFLLQGAKLPLAFGRSVQRNR
jgi:xanthine/uracil/vitamin C permease (AzgA family)